MKKEESRVRGVRLSDKIWNALLKEANKDGRTPSNLIRLILDKHLEKKGR